MSWTYVAPNNALRLTFHIIPETVQFPGWALARCVGFSSIDSEEYHRYNPDTEVQSYYYIGNIYRCRLSRQDANTAGVESSIRLYMDDHIVHAYSNGGESREPTPAPGNATHIRYDARSPQFNGVWIWQRNGYWRIEFGQDGDTRMVTRFTTKEKDIEKLLRMYPVANE